LFFDEIAGSCWMVVNSEELGPSGPSGFDIYHGSDCFSFVGTRSATVGPNITHNLTAFGAQALQRTGRGTRWVSSSAFSPVELMPMAVRIAGSENLMPT
jgi:hypothetical protein